MCLDIACILSEIIGRVYMHSFCPIGLVSPIKYSIQYKYKLVCSNIYYFVALERVCVLKSPSLFEIAYQLL